MDDRPSDMPTEPDAAGGADGHLHRFIALLPVGAAFVHGERLIVNATVEQLTGWGPDDIHAVDDWFRVHYGEDAPAVRRLYELDRAAGFPEPRTVELRRRDGERRMMEFRAREAGGAVVWTLHDVTERERIEMGQRLLADVGSLLDTGTDVDDLLARIVHILGGRLGDACLIELAAHGGDPARRIVASNLEGELRERGVAYLQSLPPLRPGSFAGRAMHGREPFLVTDTDAATMAAAGQSADQVSVFATLGVRSLLTVPMVAHDEALGAMTFVTVGDRDHLDRDDLKLAELLSSRIALAIASVRNMAAAEAELAERRRVEVALRDSQRRLEEAQRLGGIGSWAWDAATDASTLSPEFERILGLPPGTAGLGLETYATLVHPEDLDIYHAMSRVALERGEPSTAAEYRIVTPDGEVRRVHVRAEWTYDEAGRPVRGFGTVQDVTAQRHLEDQLRHAQKMEAVGRLAGGLAHDFNNLLTVIGGAAELLLAGEEAGEACREEATEIHRAAQRAAELTRQLLTFSRRQVVHPRNVDLAALVLGARRMLRRLLDASVRLDTELAPAVPLVYADPGQLEQVLVNLVVNARDALAEGGRIAISVRTVVLDEVDATRRDDAPAGEYVVLSVSDDGIGMSDATMARIFEPFFTTKETGRGTGLGLSTVFGIVRQAGGHVRVRSSPGAGSTFDVFLPRAARATPAATPTLAVVGAANGSETILVVDDEPLVRAMVRRALEGHGYDVVEAGSGDEALAISDALGRPIHLLLTDVVLPGMNGREAAEELERRRPGLRVLYMSGYTDDLLLHHRVAELGLPFLAKPFTVSALATAVRAVLDA